MPVVFIPYEGWSPGGSDFGEGWKVVSDLYSAFGSWRPFRAFLGAGTAINDGPVTGAYTHAWATGLGGSTSYVPDAQTIFAGTDTHLYTVDPTSGTPFANVSRVALYGANGAAWRFAGVGNDIWATNWLDPMQRRTNNAGLFADGVVSTFKPVPRFLATVREHLLAANLNQAGRFQDEVAWSDADDPTNFDRPTGTSLSIASSKRLISVRGQITGLVGGQYALAFKREGIFYLEYTGTTQGFRPDVLSPKIGTSYPSSIVNSRYGVFFLGPDGFYQIQGLAEPRDISPPAVDQVLLDSGFTNFTKVNYTAALEDLQIVGFEHPELPLVGWIFKADLDQIANTDILLYEPVTGVWSRASIQTAGLLSTMVSRPYAPTIYDALAGFTWSGAQSKYAPWSSTTIRPPTMALRYRPVNWEQASTHKQSVIKGVLPMFSPPGGSPHASILVEMLTDPFQGVWKSEARASTERNPDSGFYPFQIAGRMPRITVTCSSGEDFQNFEGCWVDEEPL